MVKNTVKYVFRQHIRDGSNELKILFNISFIRLQHVNKTEKPNLHGNQNCENPTKQNGHFQDLPSTDKQLDVLRHRCTAKTTCLTLTFDYSAKTRVMCLNTLITHYYVFFKIMKISKLFSLIVCHKYIDHNGIKTVKIHCNDHKSRNK